eukprot:CAMPEP_0179898622 /NCGR_PEP_ID=MMETSP0982-20121206/37774_1 /TAXON_ID=483367 /ORGANISM="non described non described, Strain CCMP 2436" /LENGTH=305 /DNA_ID=CAMNT_0021796005 /DNA_START=119 /DNA_END=1037 /DNA_ORIENTATION=-
MSGNGFDTERGSQALLNGAIIVRRNKRQRERKRCRRHCRATLRECAHVEARLARLADHAAHGDGHCCCGLDCDSRGDHKVGQRHAHKRRAVVDEPVWKHGRDAQEEHVAEERALVFAHLGVQRGHLLSCEGEQDFAADEVRHEVATDPSAYLAAHAEHVREQRVAQPANIDGPLIVQRPDQDRQDHRGASAEGPEDLEERICAPEAQSGVPPVVSLVLLQAAPQAKYRLPGLAHEPPAHHVEWGDDVCALRGRQRWRRPGERRGANGDAHSEHRVGCEALIEREPSHRGPAAIPDPRAHVLDPRA